MPVAQPDAVGGLGQHAATPTRAGSASSPDATPSDALPRRLGTAARWPVGVVLTSWRYMWRTTPLPPQRGGGPAGRSTRPRRSRTSASREEIQHPPGGVGPLFHRIYRARIREARRRPGGADRHHHGGSRPRGAERSSPASPRCSATQASMAVGDEYVVRMPGPWDGPVRVVERTPTSFRFVTLDGHLEAGQIRFSGRARRAPRVPRSSRGRDRATGCRTCSTTISA